MKNKIRIMVLFGSPFLYGSEKANIDVFVALNDYEDIEFLFLIDQKRGIEIIGPYLKERNIDFVRVPYHFMFYPGLGLKDWILKLFEICLGSIKLFVYTLKFKPTHYYTSKQDYFLNFLPFLHFTRKPIIYRIGDSPVTHNIAHRKVWKYMTGKINRFICVSKFIELEVQNSVIKKVNTKVIYSRPHGGEKLISREPTFRNPFTVLFVGQMGSHKGVHLLVEAAIYLCKKYLDIKYIIAGKLASNNTFALKLKDEVKKNNLSDRIEFVGYIMPVDSLYTKSDLHVCPSIYNEPLANVIIDAKSFSVPSIIFSVGGLPEIIEDKYNGIICNEKSAQALIEAMEFCFLNREMTKIMGKRAFQSLKKLDIKNFGHNWRNVFKETM